jgi:hypothetical protein
MWLQHGARRWLKGGLMECGRNVHLDVAETVQTVQYESCLLLHGYDSPVVCRNQARAQVLAVSKNLSFSSKIRVPFTVVIVREKRP